MMTECYYPETFGIVVSKTDAKVSNYSKMNGAFVRIN